MNREAVKAYSKMYYVMDRIILSMPNPPATFLALRGEYLAKAVGHVYGPGRLGCNLG